MGSLPALRPTRPSQENPAAGSPIRAARTTITHGSYCNFHHSAQCFAALGEIGFALLLPFRTTRFGIAWEICLSVVVRIARQLPGAQADAPKPGEPSSRQPNQGGPHNQTRPNLGIRLGRVIVKWQTCWLSWATCRFLTGHSTPGTHTRREL